MVADTGDPRFDKFARPRTVVVDSLTSARPLSLSVFPARLLYPVNGIRLSAVRRVDLGYGVKADMFSVIDDKLLVTWNWYPVDLDQRPGCPARVRRGRRQPRGRRAVPAPEGGFGPTLSIDVHRAVPGQLSGVRCAIRTSRTTSYSPSFARAGARTVAPLGVNTVTGVAGRASTTASAEEKEYALDRAINGLRDDHPMKSASQAVYGWQRPALIVLLVALAGFAAWQPMNTAVALIGLCTLGYVLTMTDRVLIFREGLASRPITVSDEAARAIPDADLPRYTILVPAYNEPEVVGDLIAAMAALEYPRDKLQVLLLLEADDEVTIEAAGACGESEVITTVLVPPAEPRTKPKACNYGLHFATGEIITIYDAEDLPEPLQLRRVVAAFARAARQHRVRAGKARRTTTGTRTSSPVGSPPNTGCGSATCCRA